MYSKEIFTNIKEIGNKVINLENFISMGTPNLNLLNEAKEDLTKLQDMEEVYWKQKATIRNLQDGNRNTKYFHALVKRKKKLLNRLIKLKLIIIIMGRSKEIADSAVIHGEQFLYHKHHL